MRMMVSPRALVPALALWTTRTFAMSVVGSSDSTKTATALPQAASMYQANLVPIDFTPLGVQEKEDALVTFRDAAMQHSGPAGSVAFIVRRPG